MRIGHRRTHSAEISWETYSQYEGNQQNYCSGKKSTISNLIDRSQAKIKEKIYTIEALSSPVNDQVNGLFNFGRGAIKVEIDLRERVKNPDSLVSIPEKIKKNCIKLKRTPETQSSSKKKGPRKSILHIEMKPKPKTPFNQQINKIIKTKIGTNEVQQKKLSLYHSEKPNPRQGKHKKQISSIK